MENMHTDVREKLDANRSSGLKIFNLVVEAACPKHNHLVFNVYKMHYIGLHIPCHGPT